MKDNYFIQFDYRTNDEYWTSDIDGFKSKQEAINKALEIIKDYIDRGKDICNFRVGKSVRANIPSIWADDIIENAYENAMDEHGDLAENYLDGITKEQCDELEQKLNDVWEEWHNKYNLYPNYFNVEDEQEFTIEEVEELIKKVK